MAKTNQTRKNIIKPDSAVIYVRAESKGQELLQRQVTSCRAFCAGRGTHVTRVFAGIGESIDTSNPYLVLQKALAFCSAKKNGISMMVIPDMASITGKENTGAYAWPSVVYANLKRNGIKLQRINYNPGDEWYEEFLDATERLDRKA